MQTNWKTPGGFVYRSFVLLLSVGIFLIPKISLAQRGQSMPLPNAEVPPPTANDGFPGFFDTNMAEKGSLVFDFPSFNFDYGITEKLNLGFNSLGALFLLTTFEPVAILKARYRLFSTETMRDTFTVYGGYAKIKETEKNPAMSASGLIITNNFTYYFSPTSQIYASTMFGRLEYTQSQDTKIDYFKQSVMPILLAVGYQHFFTERIGLSPLLMVNVYTNQDIDSAQASVSASSSASAAATNAILRLALDIKLGDSFLLSVYQISTYGEDGFATVPWASFMYRW